MYIRWKNIRRDPDEHGNKKTATQTTPFTDMD